MSWPGLPEDDKWETDYRCKPLKAMLQSLLLDGITRNRAAEPAGVIRA